MPAPGRDTTRPEDPMPEWRTWAATNRTAILVFAGFTVLVVGVLDVVMRSGGDDSAAAVAANAAAATSMELPADLPTARQPIEPIDLVIHASPSTAVLAIDGVNVGSAPYHGHFPRDGEVHRVAASAEGYETKVEAIRSPATWPST